MSLRFIWKESHLLFVFVCNILYVQKIAMSLHDLFDSSSQGANALGFVSPFANRKQCKSIVTLSVDISEKNTFSIAGFRLGLCVF